MNISIITEVNGEGFINQIEAKLQFALLNPCKEDPHYKRIAIGECNAKSSIYWTILDTKARYSHWFLMSENDGIVYLNERWNR